MPELSKLGLAKVAKLPGFLKDRPKVLGMDLKDILLGGAFSLVVSFKDLPPIYYLVAFISFALFVGLLRKLEERGKGLFPLFKKDELEWTKED